MSHYDDDELARYLTLRGTRAEDPAVEAHVATCDDCASRLALAEQFEAGLTDVLPWDLLSEAESSPEIPDDLRRLADEMQRDRAAAERLLAPVVVSPIAFTRAQIDRDPRYRNAAVVRALVSFAETMREQQPRFALQLADTAIAIGTKLDRAGALKATGLLGRAWMERIIALTLIGRFHEADLAADEAEKAYDRDPHSTPHDLAMVWLCRSILLLETGNLVQAQFFAASAARPFAEFGDHARLLKARLASGNVLYMLGRYAEAASEFEVVVRLARRGNDPLLLLRGVQCLGQAFVAVKQYDEAIACFAESLALAERSGADSERARAIWAIGNVLLQTGEFNEALERLDEARRSFDALSVVNDGALVRLHLAEALLAVGRHPEVPALLNGVAMTFAAEGMTRNASLAIAYLREAATRGTVDASLLQHVRTYLEELPAHPERPFVPLI